jgi:diguanylate cyclase (GGDEF)-like protein/PAS domain S-box-containing protein
MLANKNEDADFLTMLLNEGIALSQVNIIPSSYQIQDLIEGKVDAFNSYTTNEPYLLRQLGIPYNIIDPISYRVDFYSDILFTSEQELNDHPLRVAAMRRATLKGWRYAMDHPEEIIELLKNKYFVQKSWQHLRFEAEEMRKLIVPTLVEIGHMNPERWLHMTNTFVKSGLVEDSRHFDGFLYDEKADPIPAWVMPTLAAALLLVFLISSITFYLHRFNRQMAAAQDTLRESEARFKALSDATYGGIIIHQNGTILECNNTLAEMTGFTYEELIGMNCFGFVVSDQDFDVALLHAQKDLPDSYEVTVMRKDGNKIPISVKGKNIDYKGERARVIEVIDITERNKTREKLQLAASVFTNAREAIVITDVNGNIIDVNGTFSEITGYSREEVLGKNPRILNSGRHSKEFFTNMWYSLLENKEWSGELWNRRKNGEIYAELVTIGAVVDNQGKTQNYVALFSDITTMKQHQQELEHTAHYDALTQLPNRMLLADRLQQAMVRSKRNDTAVAVAYLDLDGFKLVNDTYGHDVGDELLVKLSSMMQGTLREGDTLARIGGDEFIVVLGDIERIIDCKIVLDRLLDVAMSPVQIRDMTLQVSTSIGVTLYPQDGVDADLLLRHADQAMYIAKQTGKNRYHMFDVHEDRTLQNQRETIEHIVRGFKQGEFSLHYQPQINMKTGKVVGAEALIRWQHRDRGLLYPVEFLPTIENHPFSFELGAWVINSALDQMVQWQESGLDLNVSVNVDAYHLRQHNFIDVLSAALDAHPTIKPRSLQLEILETSALGDIAEALSTIRACIDLGVSFALDDFGTGFSSLTYLKRLPVELLKIDRTFVRDMLDDQDDRAIVAGVIGLASAFHRRVIAEGVETMEHANQLLAMGCVLAQGYGIAKPMPAENVPAWIEEWQPVAV